MNNCYSVLPKGGFTNEVKKESQDMTPTKIVEKRKTDGIWSDENLEKLRRCRNRAYHKYNVKRRQHLHASLASYLIKEWQVFYPDSKITGKALLDVYTFHFENKDQQAVVSSKKKPRTDEQIPDESKNPPAIGDDNDRSHFSPSVKIYDDHRDKQWSDLMLTNLLQCGDTAEARLRAGEKSDFATILYDEWKKIYPCSTLTSRNIKSRFTVYQKTKPDLPPPSKRRKTISSPVRSPIEDNRDVVSEVDDGPAIGSHDDSNMVCPKHAIHLFHDKDESVECFLTEQLLGIRVQLEPQFPGCDIYKPKKPKGFAAAVLQEWKRFYPNSEETNKTISFKLAKYDRIPEEENFGVKVTPKGRTVWSQVMLKHLSDARKTAIEEARRIGSPQSVARLWKEEWQNMYPDLSSDWKSIVSRYNYHFGSIDSLNPDFDDPEKLLDEISGGETGNNRTSSSVLSDEISFENIKGFRKWTQKMMVDLLETKARLGASHPNVEPGSSEFNKLLLTEFQKLHPKCMESSRSIYSKLQSIEKEDQFRGLRSTINLEDVPASVLKSEPEDDQVVPISADSGPVRAISVQDNFVSDEQFNESQVQDEENVVIEESFSKSKHNEIAEESSNTEIKTEIVEEDVCPVKSDESSSAELKDDEPVPKDEVKEEEEVVADSENPNIEGFEGWTIHMIKDFVSCMDATRKKFSQLKEKEPEGAHIKLVPLLLEGWKETYPATTETVKTFQTRIKHLSQQKEIIKKHLGLLRSKTVEKEEEPFRWNKGMIQDVIDSRKMALSIKDAELKKGRKVSFHTLWSSEFKKIYPNSTFTSNNLSVHFWTWRKQQQKNSSKKGKQEIASPQSSPPPVSNVKSDPFVAGHVWNRAAKIRLLEVGKKVEEMMRDQGTPNEVKVTGFANMLFEEWKKAHPDRELDSKLESARCLNLTYSKVVKDGPGHDDDDLVSNEKHGWTTASKLLLLKVGQKVEDMLQTPTTPNEIKLEGFGNLLQSEWRKQDHANGSGSETIRSLTMMYTKLQKEGLKLEESEDIEPRGIMATWTPKHNRVLQDCMEKFSDLATPAEYSTYKSCVIKSWRTKFTKSSISDAMLWRKITDLSHSEVSQLHNLNKSEPELIDLDDVKKEPANATFSMSDKDKMVWNMTAIRDLFEAHRKAQKELSSTPTKYRPQLSNLVHLNFIRLHKNCQLVPSVLMAKLFSYKTAVNKGLLDIKPALNESSNEIQTTSMETSAPPKIKTESSAKSKNLVFRTWTQAMIDDMMATRKIALIKKKKRLEADTTDTVPMAEIWYEEFMKLQPDYKSTKKNLWRKYKWYKSRMGQASADKKEGSSPKKEDRKNIVWSKIEESKFVPALEEQLSLLSPVVPMKSIRKDVFNYIKAVLEEPRIFLPPKFSEPFPTTPISTDQFVTPPPLQSFVRPISTFRIAPGSTMSQPQSFIVPPPLSVPVMTASGVRPTVSFISSGSNQIIQTVAPMQQQHQQQTVLSLGGPVMSIFPNGGPWQGLPPRQLTIMSVPQMQESNSGNNSNDSIKLPGGATLVAVTDRNADQLLKPKHLEKPHVTITIGDRQEGAGTSIKVENSQQQQLQQQHQQQQLQQQLSHHHSALMMSQQPPQTATLTAIIHTPTQQIPLTIPYPINVPHYQPRPSVVQPPPLTQLRPQVPEPSNQLSTRVRTRLGELNIPESMFGELINLYSSTRDEFISTLKKGYLAFFPFMLGAEWREKYSGISNVVTGRKLASLMDLYSEDRRKGKVASPEYLTKVPSNFSVTEVMLKQLMVCHTEARNLLLSHLKMTCPLPIIYHEMCRRWPKFHPEVRMTTKQLISVHHMLSYEPDRDATPEIDCQLAEIWKTMDREVPLLAAYESLKEIKRENVEDDDDEAVYDESNVSMDQLQEWFLSTENIFGNRISNRPRFIVRGARWCLDDRKDLTFFRKVVHRRWLDSQSRYRRLSQMDFLHRTWKRFNPQSFISKLHLTARCVREVRRAKLKEGKRENDQIRKWRHICEEFCANEESIVVHDEVEEERKRKKQIERDELMLNKKSEISSAGHAHAGFSGRLTSLSRHANLSVDNWKKDFNKDENVLDYIGAMQKSSIKGTQPITWTPEVIRDLMKARAEARKRKRIWEDWAVKKYGGVGIAYNLPNVKFTKVDDMFREEWIKLRPEMSNLSIWTLVSYARKFDNLKKQLIEANGDKVIKETNSKVNSEEKVKPSVAMLFFPESSIPKYNLEKLESLKDIPRELKNLLKSRQMAKERQTGPETENSKFTLNHFWEEAWCELQPESSLNGNELQRLLFRYEQNALVRARLIPALLSKDDNETEPSSDSPHPQPDEILSVKPRNFVFPENEEVEDFSLFCYQNRPVSRGAIGKHFANLERDILRPNHPVFEIPIVSGVPVASPGNVSTLRWSAKGYSLIEKTSVSHPELTFCHDEGKYWCTTCDCYYDNVNNFVFHQRIHRLPDDENKSNLNIAMTTQ